MKAFLRQSTSFVYSSDAFIDVADGKTGKTALSSQTGRITKNGAAGAAFTPVSWTHEYGGSYLIGCAAGDAGTLGMLRIAFYDQTTHLGVVDEFMVIPAAEYDLIFKGQTAAEIGAPPAETAGLAGKVDWIFATARNKRDAAGGVETVYKADQVTPLATAAVANNGATTTRNKWS